MTYTFGELQKAVAELGNTSCKNVGLYDVIELDLPLMFGRLADKMSRSSVHTIKPSDFLKLHTRINSSFNEDLQRALSGIKVYKDLLAALQLLLDAVPSQESFYIAHNRLRQYQRQLNNKKEHDQYLQGLIEDNIRLQKELSAIRVEHEKKLLSDFYSRLHNLERSGDTSRKVESLIAEIGVNTLRTKSIYSLMSFSRLMNATL